MIRREKLLWVLFFSLHQGEPGKDQAPYLFQLCCSLLAAFHLESSGGGEHTRHLSLFEPADVNLSARVEGSSPGEKQRADLKAIVENRCYFVKTEFISGWPGSMSVALLHPQQVISNKLGREE